VALTVAVTGPTGTFGHGLMSLLQGDERVERVVGIARRPFDPAGAGWTKLHYHQGDVRDRAALGRAFEGADVVVHLAFVVTGAGAGRQTIRAVNVDGTRNAFAAAADAGARRFVYSSSVSAYGFHPGNPMGMTEEWPVRRAAHLFYAQEKAEIEQLLAEEATLHPELDVYILRPPIVLGPHSTGAKTLWPGPLEPVGRALAAAVGRLPVALPAIVPPLPLQFVHEEDVGDALLRCVAGAGPPGAYNIAGDGVLTAVDVARELGLAVLPAPGRPVQAAARLLAGVPFAPPVAGWAEAMSHPAIVDTGKARRELGWRPRYSGLEALRDTLHRR
jgi:nucleoside-diphosphate-sugar epimerase